ncbi:MAG: ASPIC/UnbV domain-containing protein [Acidobacteriota bacterium]
MISRFGNLLAAALVLGAACVATGCGDIESDVVDDAGRADAPPPSVDRSAVAIDPSSISFTDVTEAAGVAWRHHSGATGDKRLPETMGGGVALFDHDDDGDADLLFVGGRSWTDSSSPGTVGPLALYRNDSADGTLAFTDITEEAGLSDVDLYGMGVAVGDADADGDRDLFVTAVGEDRLFRAEHGVYVDVTAEAGVGGGSGDDAWSTSAGFFDADADGDLDLFVLRYVRWSPAIDAEVDPRADGVGRVYGPPGEYRGTFPVLYLNRGDGTFEDASADAGIHLVEGGAPLAKALGLTFVDLDGDLDGDPALDVLVANDTVRDFAFRNLGDGRFEETGEFLGVAYDADGRSTGGMGIDAGYLGQDDNLSIVIGNFDGEASSLFRAQDDPEFFVEESIATGLAAATRDRLTFGLVLLDVDLDGRLDLVQANGHVEPQIADISSTAVYRQPGQLLLGREGRFEEAPSIGALAEPLVGRGLAYADLDLDGDLDLVLTALDERPRILRNDQATGHRWLRVRLIDRAPNRDAIGARVELTVDGTTQRRRVVPTRSYLSQVESTLTFGLGTATSIDELTVVWPDGSRELVEVDGLDRLVVVRSK